MQGKARDHRSTSLVDFGLVLNQYLFTGTMSEFVESKGYSCDYIVYCVTIPCRF